MKIAIITPKGLGGVSVITLKLTQGLIKEGFYVDLIKIHSGTVINSFVNDLRIIHELKNYDAILYTGSIARVSSILRRKYAGLFIHGFLLDEYRNAILHSDIRTSLGALLEFTWWKTINMNIFKPSFYICHSKTACRNNMISENKCVILPQFVLPTEVEWFKKFREKLTDSHLHNNATPMMLIYTSFAGSPRLLSINSLIYIAKRLGRFLRRSILFYIIKPKTLKDNVYQFDKVKVIVKDFMPRIDFLRLLAIADLYIEPSIDEEIGLDSIEAGLLKIPLAKITSPKFTSLQDFTRDEVIFEENVSHFVYSLSEYFNNIERYKNYYGSKFLSFISRKRSWEIIKKPLTKKLYELSSHN
ncbi:MAG: hypothetical protein QXT31_08065 [Candidatus Bathyarchaeia archaeon]